VPVVKRAGVSFPRQCAVVELCELLGSSGSSSSGSSGSSSSSSAAEMQAALIDAVANVGFEATVLPGLSAVLLRVEGMMCQTNCGSTVHACLAKVEGVLFADVSFAHQSAAVVLQLQPFETLAAKADQLVAAVEGVGFDASVVSAPTATATATATATSTAHTSRRVGPSQRSLDAAEAVRKAQEKFARSDDGSSSHRRSYTYSVENVSCAACVGKIERALTAIAGVDDAAVNLSTGQVRVFVVSAAGAGGIEPDAVSKASSSSSSSGFDPRSVEAVLLDLGYPAKLNSGTENKCERLRLAREKEVNGWRALLRLSLVFAVPVVVIHMVLLHIPYTARALNRPFPGGEWWWGEGEGDGGGGGGGMPSIQAVLQWALSTPVQFYVGGRFFRGAWSGLKHCNLGLVVGLCGCGCGCGCVVCVCFRRRLCCRLLPLVCRLLSVLVLML
jgi:cation transport ATPase